GARLELLDDGAEQPLELDGLSRGDQPALVGLRDVEEVRDHAQQRAALLLDAMSRALRTRARGGVARDDLRLQLDRVHRVLEIVNEERRELLASELQPLKL